MHYAIKATVGFGIACLLLASIGGCSPRKEKASTKVTTITVATADLPDLGKMQADHEEHARRSPPPIRMEDAVSSQIWLSDTGRLITDEDIVAMAKDDAKVVQSKQKAIELAKEEGREFNDWFHKNGVDSHETVVGKFEIVSSFGHYSVDCDGISNGGMRHEVLVTPSGRKYRMFPSAGMLRGIIEVSGRVFMVTNREVLEWAPDADRPNDDRLIRRVDAPNPTYISHTRLGKYVQVDHSNESIFGGLLVPNGEKHKPWRFVECPIKGTMVCDAVQQEDGTIRLTAWVGDELVFDPVAETFEKFATK